VGCGSTEEPLQLVVVSGACGRSALLGVLVCPPPARLVRNHRSEWQIGIGRELRASGSGIPGRLVVLVAYLLAGVWQGVSSQSRVERILSSGVGTLLRVC